MKQEPLGSFHPNQLKSISSNREKQTTQGLIKFIGAIIIAIAFLVVLYVIKSRLGINLVEGSPVGDFLDVSGICEYFAICHDTLTKN